LDEIIELMEKKYGKAKRTWVFDRGIVSEDNLETLRQMGSLYIVGTRRGLLKQFEKEISEKEWEEVEEGIEVKIIETPDNKLEKFVICKSVGREEKEKAILELQKVRLKNRLVSIQKLVQKGKLKDAVTIGQRIGKWMGRYTKAERLYTTEIIYNAGTIVDLKIHDRKENMEWAHKTGGHYILRTNWTETDPKIIWKMYMQLNHAENSFRIGKSDLQVRPVYHQTQERVQAHIFVCFLALCSWRTLEQIAQSKGIGNCVSKLLNEISEVRSMDIVLPVKGRNPLRLRIVAKPEDHVKELLYRLNLKLPNQPKILAEINPEIFPSSELSSPSPHKRGEDKGEGY
jgi:transposase